MPTTRLPLDRADSMRSPRLTVPVRSRGAATFAASNDWLRSSPGARNPVSSVPTLPP